MFLALVPLQTQDSPLPVEPVQGKASPAWREIVQGLALGLALLGTATLCRLLFPRLTLFRAGLIAAVTVGGLAHFEVRCGMLGKLRKSTDSPPPTVQYLVCVFIEYFVFLILGFVALGQKPNTVNLVVTTLCAGGTTIRASYR